MASGERDIVVEKCKSKRCLTCPDLVLATSFKSSSTGYEFTGEYFFDEHEERVLRCTTVNCIYLLTCKGCRFQYVGETVQQLRVRMSGHRSSIDHDSNCYRVKEHFATMCLETGFSITIIGKLAGNGRTTVKKGKTFEMDNDVTLLRRGLEIDWIRQLQTSYPYGMNVKLDNIPNKSKYKSTFGLMVSTKSKRRKSWSKNFTVEEDKLKIVVNQILAFMRLPYQSRFAAEVKKLMFSLRKKSLFVVRDMLLKNFCEHWSTEKLEASPLYLVVLDFLQYKLDPMVKSDSTPKRRPKLVCTLTFVNKGVEMLHLPSIFRKCQSFVSDCEHKVPDVAYRFTETIGPKLFNFKQTVASYDHTIPLEDQYECICHQHPGYIDSSCGHVATGDITLVSDKGLRNIISKGPGYREPQTIDVDNLFTSVTNELKEFIKSWSKKEKLAPQFFDEWYSKVIALIRERMDGMTKRYKFPKRHSVFSTPDAKECLTDLKKHFVLVPVDKAAKNIALICKRFYMKVLLDEMESNVETYRKCHEEASCYIPIKSLYIDLCC